MNRIILVSFTSLNSPGGVPRWNRDFIKCFGDKNEILHFSWDDVRKVYGDSGLPEWEKAKVLAKYLWHMKAVTVDDIVIGDGFWADGYHNNRTVSVCHGIWGHLIKEEADAGKAPDFPLHHSAQIEFRKRFTSTGGRLVAVSEFIQHQMDIQWGFKSKVINNAVDFAEFQPAKQKLNLAKPLIIHGVNDRGNENKGWSFIEEVSKKIDAYVMSLDEAHKNFGGSRDKYHTLSLADVAVIPSGYEGNSYFAMECLALGVPVIAYDVGYFWQISPFNPRNVHNGALPNVGQILDRKTRDKVQFAEAVDSFIKLKRSAFADPRKAAVSLESFKHYWREYLTQEFGLSWLRL